MIAALNVAAFIWSVLAADTGPGGVSTALGGRIYNAPLIPQAAAMPAANITVVPGSDANTLGGVRAFEIVTIDVRVVTAGSSYGPIKPIAARIDELLQNRGGTYDGVAIVELVRQQPTPLAESESGTVYTHLIQTYRTEAYALS